MENQGKQNQPNAQQNQQQDAQQRIQQYEEIAKHYAEAASALRNNDEAASERHLQQAQQARQQQGNQSWNPGSQGDQKYQNDGERQDPNTHM
ncbi:MAG: hypothetical protein KL787_09900 [Taibaiella sp.]|nr:hypothetical protein [Taibaiella sp.]